MKPVKKNRTLAKAVLAVGVAVVLIGPAKTQQKGALGAEPKGDWHDTSWANRFSQERVLFQMRKQQSSLRRLYCCQYTARRRSTGSDR